MPSYSPLFIRYDPTTGEVDYQFDGHVIARGLDFLNADTGLPAFGDPTDPRTVSWIDSSGAQVAFIQGSGAPDILGIQSGNALLKLGESGATDYIQARTQGNLTVILQGRGLSNFMQMVGYSGNPKLVRYFAVSAIALPALAAGASWSSGPLNTGADVDDQTGLSANYVRPIIALTIFGSLCGTSFSADITTGPTVTVTVTVTNLSSNPIGAGGVGLSLAGFVGYA